MLHDFCHAFPTLLHEWMWLVLNVLQLPKHLIKVIECLYTSIKAFSSGCGDGSFLFEVLGGVSTGCPLSSILFLLCCNPFIDLMLRFSDGLKYRLLVFVLMILAQPSKVFHSNTKRRFLTLLLDVLACI